MIETEARAQRHRSACALLLICSTLLTVPAFAQNPPWRQGFTPPSLRATSTDMPINSLFFIMHGFWYRHRP